MSGALQSYRVLFTEGIGYERRVEAASAIEAARLVAREYIDIGTESMAMVSVDNVDWMAVDENGNVETFPDSPEVFAGDDEGDIPAVPGDDR